MNTQIVLYTNAAQMRERSALASIVGLIEDSCFFSAEAPRHEQCRERAVEILGLDPDAPSSEILEAINENRNNFLFAFYCEGAAAVCVRCGGLIEPGMAQCPECGQKLREPLGVLAKPEWELRLTTRALEIAINTSTIVDELLTHTINRTVRLLVLRNLLGQSEWDDWKSRVKDVQAHVISAWPEDNRPDKTSWEWRYVREVATFWIVGYPMLKRYLTLDEIDQFSTKIIRAIAVSSRRWAEEGADGDDYGQVVKGLLATPGLDKERAIRELRPEDLQGHDSGDDDVEPAVVFHAPEILMRGKITRNEEGKPWITAPLEEREVEFLTDRFGITEESIEALVAMMVEGSREAEEDE